MYVLMVPFTMRNKFALCNQVGEPTEPLRKTIRRWLFHVFFQQWNDAPERSHCKISFIKKSFLSRIGGNHAVS